MSFEYKIQEKIGILSKRYTGETLELNIIQYGDYDAKYDLRRWESGIMHKGVTLNENELKKLRDLINNHLNNKNKSEILEEFVD